MTAWDVALAALAAARVHDESISQDRADVALWRDQLAAHGIAITEATGAVNAHYGESAYRVLPRDVIRRVVAERRARNLALAGARNWTPAARAASPFIELTRAGALAVECPHCHADAGSGCTARDGRPLTMTGHPARINAAKALVGAE